VTAARADLEVVELDDLDVPDDTTDPERWEPDAQLVASVLASPKAWRGMLKQPEPDRALLVAGLTVAGLTAKQIADRTTCSLRLIRFIRAKDMTQVCVYALEQVTAVEAELNSERSEHVLTRQNLAEVSRELERLRAQFDQLIDAHVAGTLKTFPRCSHPKVKYNVYEHGGKTYCRECNRLRKQTRRQRTAESQSAGTVLTARQIPTVLA